MLMVLMTGAGGVVIRYGLGAVGPAWGAWGRSLLAAGLSVLVVTGLVALTFLLPADAFLNVVALSLRPLELVAGPSDDIGPSWVLSLAAVVALPVSWLIVRLVVRDERGGMPGWGASLVAALLFTLLAVLLLALSS